MPLSRVITIFFALAFSVNLLNAQQDTTAVLRKPKPCEIKLADGTSYKGIIEKKHDSLIFLRASSGVLILVPKKQVAEIDLIKGNRKKDTIAVGAERPSIGKRYYVTASNALLFRKKEVFASSSYLALLNINYAFNTHFSLGLSTTVIGAPLGIHAKANFELGNNFYLGVEGAAGSMMYLNPQTYASGGVVKLTFGDEAKNYTVFMGYATLDYWVKGRGRSRWGPATPGYYLRFRSPFAGVAASLPMNQRLQFVGEAFAFPSISIYTASVALRTVRRQKLSFVFGIQVIGNTSANVNKAFSLPYFGISAGF